MPPVSPLPPVKSIAFIGNSLPRRCGIGTFTHDLQTAVAEARPDVHTCVVAMTDRGRSYAYPPQVCFEIHADERSDYARAAGFLNGGGPTGTGFDVVSVQHEFGIFGGPAGNFILDTLTRLKMPIVTTLHTILADPPAEERAVIRRLNELSARFVVMSQKGRQFLRSVHGIPNRKIDVIAHGIPDAPLDSTHEGKANLGLAGRTVILTFGLLSPNKGIETVIEAMPKIIEACPNATYVVLGATHPNLVRDCGEAYRQTLMARTHELGVEDHVVFVDQFVDQPTLIDYIAMCDVYVTPYLHEAQMTSGTLAYSFGLGKPVISTPYWHAQELLADGRGVIVPFGDSRAVGTEIAALLTDESRREAIGRRAYAESRSMTWAATAERYVAVFEAARAETRAADASAGAPLAKSIAKPSGAQTVAQAVSNGLGGDGPLPAPRLGHFVSMCDDTGMLQHAVLSVADRHHGYCVDDNARALILALALGRPGETSVSDTLTGRFAAFIQHAWNPDTLHFRNFMSFDRRWLEDRGSEDSHGRTLWALGECARYDTDAARRQWAQILFRTALPTVKEFVSIRSWTFSLLGLDAYCTAVPDDQAADQLRLLLCDRLMARLELSRSDDWVWFEDTLAYDNARLPQALILTGLSTGTSSYVMAGLETLTWLMTKQTAPSGCFRPVGSDSFALERQNPKPFDQQPVEAAATISACLAADRADRRAGWTAVAIRTYSWFTGDNDLGRSLVDPLTGSCYDGLHADRPNQNRGAESTLSYLLELVEIRRHLRPVKEACRLDASNVLRGLDLSATAMRAKAGGHLVSIPNIEPPERLSQGRSIQGRRQTVQTGD